MHLCGCSMCAPLSRVLWHAGAQKRVVLGSGCWEGCREGWSSVASGTPCAWRASAACMQSMRARSKRLIVVVLCVVCTQGCAVRFIGACVLAWECSQWKGSADCGVFFLISVSLQVPVGVFGLAFSGAAVAEALVVGLVLGGPAVLPLIWSGSVKIAAM